MENTTILVFAICSVSVALSDISSKTQNRVFFDPGQYRVQENVGTISLTVARQGRDLTKTMCVDFKTADGTAKAGSDYEYTEGTVIFYPGDTHKQFPLTIIDDNTFEEDEYLHVKLSNIREGRHSKCNGKNIPVAKLDSPFLATIMILDDDHPGQFEFEEAAVTVSDTIGVVTVKVVRTLGARGQVSVHYHTVDGTARSGVDFTPVNDNLTFENDETEQVISVTIIDTPNTEMREFTVMLGEPKLIGGPWPGTQPLLGDVSKIKIQITGR